MEVKKFSLLENDERQTLFSLGMIELSLTLSNRLLLPILKLVIDL
jgi:hypothetical protein